MATKSPVIINGNTTPFVTDNTSSTISTEFMNFWTSLLTQMYVTFAFITVLIIAFDLLLLVVLLSSPSLRSNFRNHLLMSLAVSYLVLGIISTPLVVDFAALGHWRHGCYMHIIVGLLYTVHNFIADWTVVLLLAHYLIRVQRYEGPAWLVRLPALFQRALPGLIVAGPWVAALAVIVPSAFAGLHPRMKYIWSDTHCPMLLTSLTLNVISCLAYYIPACCLVGLSIRAVILWRRRCASVDTVSRADSGSILVGSPVDIESPTAYLATAGLTVVVLAPKFLYLSVRTSTKIFWKTYITLVWVTSAFNDALPFLHCFVWLLLFRDIRDRLTELVVMVLRRFGLCRSRSPPASSGNTSVPPVAFSNVSEE